MQTPTPVGAWRPVLAGLGLLWLLTTGCSSFRTELGRSLSAPGRQFVPGETSAQTVLHLLGPPGQVSALPGGFAFLYEHSRLRELQLGISLNVPVIKYFKYIHAWNHLQQEVTVMTFDDRGLLRSCSAESWEEDLGGGNAVQFLFSVVSLSDRAAFRRPDYAHTWGRACLLRAPVALNSEQSLRSGAHGLQLRTAPAYVGQSTLEMVKPKKLKSKKRPKTLELY